MRSSSLKDSRNIIHQAILYLIYRKNSKLLKRNINILKTDLEEEKLGWTDERKRKTALKAKYEKRSYKFKKQKEEEAEVEAAENEAEAVKIYNRQRTEEIDETIDEIKKNKTASNESKVKSLQNLQDSKELPLKGYQKVRIKRLLRKYAPVEVDETADTKTFLGALKKIFKGKNKWIVEKLDKIEDIEFLADAELEFGGEKISSNIICEPDTIRTELLMEAK